MGTIQVQKVTTASSLSTKPTKQGGEAGGAASEGALGRLLRRVRDAWPEPRSLYQARESSGRPLSVSEDSIDASHLSGIITSNPRMMPSRGDASPGLLRRRYSVPETIMRKYRVSKQRADCEEVTSRDSGCAGSARSTYPRTPPRDRDLMRRSALLRRLWGRVPPSSCYRCRHKLPGSHSRSLDGSHSELRSELPDLSASTYRDTSVELPTSPSPTPSTCEIRRDTIKTPTGLVLDQNPRELLEIVVTETGPVPSRPTRSPAPSSPKLDIDEYVSSVLLESLNLLSDRLECITSHGHGELNVLEKEIKVKLQSTGVNTLVHLSPTSNNQIIFGNEEICDGQVGTCNPPVCIRDESSAVKIDGATERRSDVDQAVLRQIRKLFDENVQDTVPATTTSSPTVSHIEISDVSNVDVVFENYTEPQPQVTTKTDTGAFGITHPIELNDRITTNYFTIQTDFETISPDTAYIHTASIELHASSSGEAEIIGSDCTSLVDSLDEPNSPRRGLLTLTPAAPREAHLVRSAIDLLDLLPETALSNDTAQHKDKSEVFFVGITDDNLNYDKEHINVADLMPESIKQRLYQRHRRRKLRAESARRNRAKVLRREAQHMRRLAETAVARECASIVEALISDVITKIAHDEMKCIRIKRGPDHVSESKSDDNPSKKNRKKHTRPIARQAQEAVASPSVHPSSVESNEEHDLKSKHHIRGKLSLHTRPAPLQDEKRPRRLFQKSEIREGNGCVEILEILEYRDENSIGLGISVDDDSQGPCIGLNRKSKIPVPVHEKRHYSGTARLTAASSDLSDISQPSNNYTSSMRLSPTQDTSESRPRSGSFRFRRVFDVIPEERSSLSVESSLEETITAATRVSTPTSQSIATSSLVLPKATAPLRVKGGVYSSRQPRLMRRSEGCREKIESNGSRPALGLGGDCRQSNSDAKRFQNQGVEGRHSKKQGRAGPEPWKSKQMKSATNRFDNNEVGDSERRIDVKIPRKVRGRSDDDPSDRDLEGQERSSSGESVLCPLAPRWLSSRRRRRASSPRIRHASSSGEPGEWSVTVAGSCRAALPADVEMRLRFARYDRRSPRRPNHRSTRCTATEYQNCSCDRRVSCTCSSSARRSGSPTSHRAPPLPAPLPQELSLTVKKEARDSSILATKSMRKSTDPLPDVETYSSSRSKMKSTVKMRRGCSQDWWACVGKSGPEDAVAGIRRMSASDGLSVCGSAIVPELKPRARTMSERDLTRLYTPRLYLRS